MYKWDIHTEPDAGVYVDLLDPEPFNAPQGVYCYVCLCVYLLTCIYVYAFGLAFAFLCVRSTEVRMNSVCSDSSYGLVC